MSSLLEVREGNEIKEVESVPLDIKVKRRKKKSVKRFVFQAVGEEKGV